MSRPPQRPIKRLLVANRGEIATRIISSARELNIETFSVYNSNDHSHAATATHAIELSSPAAFMNIDELIAIAQKHNIDAVHPGYGFLSESDVFAQRMWEEAGVAVVGPGWAVLASTGDKLKARQLAEQCHVPVSPALQTPTSNVDDVRRFAAEIGYPVMIKAVDGGGGRGIRLVQSEGLLAANFRRAVEESPSKQVFAEKAAVDGFRHVEVQIIGDGTNVTHLWERECSIQRRYQKVVEFAPSVIEDRALVARVIGDALKMARHIHYFSLGTFEFLVNPRTKEYYFLEVNPRLQVEHTITESISMTDIVTAQLLLAQGASLETCGLPTTPRPPETPPLAHSIQLRITAEDVENNWTLSIGKITSFRFPTGNGIRIDTHLTGGRPAVVSADYDSLIAKVIVTASSWPAAVRKAQRALQDTDIRGVKTNISVLRAIVSHPAFLAGECDTQWLERNHAALLHTSHRLAAPISHFPEPPTALPSLAAAATTIPPFRPGDSWTLTLTPTTPNAAPQTHHLTLTTLLQNNFPAALRARIAYTTPTATTPYTLSLTSTSASASAATSAQRRADPGNAGHVAIPFPGRLVEVCVDEGDLVREGDVVCVVQQMKMELEVRAGRGGRVGWVFGVEEGAEVDVGWLAAVVEAEGGARL
ncbi:carbamoyl-phosphate synthase L chain, ATP binding domain-containing protein [Boeremia exigua]|uniref:carbamoyl-phosphate synthase L chain, ATP binding domain-containing protein n=1 Tax=Boeremia exigua TaxID=749465 RepID=UPI001E8CC184|nr:carbamoyl-phosphate synthase L chain, ATP binding domain-containing protein [Boeremia exigua]KAH6629179.1 carbamoyl-phosphate synthase L chain, ATP binding domain-containing protein [Boeremia exigua]